LDGEPLSHVSIESYSGNAPGVANIRDVLGMVAKQLNSNIIEQTNIYVRLEEILTLLQGADRATARQF
jgi:hypothetical protein